MAMSYGIYILEPLNKARTRWGQPFCPLIVDREIIALFS